MSKQDSAPIPVLRIVPTQNVHPHEEHDSQRSGPLIERIRNSMYMTNPPLVAEMGEGHYVVLDGSNRHYSFSHLGYKHMLVQVVNYDSSNVQLSVWQHVVSGWTQEDFANHIRAIPGIQANAGWSTESIAQIMLKDGLVMAIHANAETVHERNAALCKVVGLYQKNANLYRVSVSVPTEAWALHPNATAFVIFPTYEPKDIMEAARLKAFLPPGISRHIINGRVLKINYPLAKLRDETTSLEAKNRILQRWLQQKLANRKVRYYAEATYQFDE